MSDETPTYKRYVVTSPVTINPAGPDEPPVILEMVQERGEVGIANGYLELAPKTAGQQVASEPRTTVEPRAAIANTEEPEAPKPTSKKAAATKKSG